MITSPLSWQLLEHVRDAIKLIQTSRGFLTDIGLHHVALEASQLPGDDQLSTLILGTSFSVPEDVPGSSKVKSQMALLIEVAVPFATEDNPQQQAHRVRFDLVRALLSLRKRIKDLPIRITDLTLTGSEIDQPDDGAAVILVQVLARAGLVESISPATQ